MRQLQQGGINEAKSTITILPPISAACLPAWQDSRHDFVPQPAHPSLPESSLVDHPAREKQNALTGDVSRRELGFVGAVFMEAAIAMEADVSTEAGPKATV